MPRRLLALVLLVIAVPTGTLAQDFCTVLEATEDRIIAARNAVSAASADVDSLRFRLGEDQSRYADEINALTEPRQDAATARELMEEALRDVSDLRAARCAPIPDGR